MFLSMCQQIPDTIDRLSLVIRGRRALDRNVANGISNYIATRVKSLTLVGSSWVKNHFLRVIAMLAHDEKTTDIDLGIHKYFFDSFDTEEREANNGHPQIIETLAPIVLKDSLKKRVLLGIPTHEREHLYDVWLADAMSKNTTLEIAQFSRIVFVGGPMPAPGSENARKIAYCTPLNRYGRGPARNPQICLTTTRMRSGTSTSAFLYSNQLCGLMLFYKQHRI